MNLLLVEESEIHRGRVRLADRRAEHLSRVLKVAAGHTVRVGRIGGGIGVGRVVEVSDGAVVLDLELAGSPALRPRVDLIVALPRPQALKRILEYAAAMHVGRIDLVNAWRVEKSFFQTPLLAPEALRRHLMLGAEQGMTTWLPEVTVERRLVSYLERVAAAPDPPLRLLAHPSAPEAIESAAAALGGVSGRVELALGPEGGWIDREVETFGEAGFRPVNLGPWILRVETALAAALAQLEMLRRTEANSRRAAC